VVNEERALLFSVGEDTLLGVLHPGHESATKGVLIVVGGPQYRIGSHRQFVLLARFLAARGIPVLRFDYRGMGDATGASRDFEHIADDIAAALAAFRAAVPGLREWVLWGLCDAAAAALLCAWRQPAISGLVLLNPWVRTEEGLAKAYLTHYYARRLFERAFWRDVLAGQIKPLAALRGMLDTAWRALAPRAAQPAAQSPAASPRLLPLPVRIAEGWQRFSGPILLILSGDDLTAAEFRDVAEHLPQWRGLLAQRRVRVRELPAANHTFARQEWRDQVALWTAEWIERLP